MSESGNVIRHPFRGRVHTVRRPSPVEALHGIATDLLPLAKGQNEGDVLSIIGRIEALAERLSGSEVA